MAADPGVSVCANKNVVEGRLSLEVVGGIKVRVQG